MKKLFKAIRTNDWWGYKFPPMLAIAYIVVLQSKSALPELYLSFIIILFALITGAAYVSLINDATDVKEDRLAGKNNNMAKFNRWQVNAIVLFPLVIAVNLVVFLADLHSIAGIFYLLSYACFTLYSLPPFRFKKRGFAGILMDALGSLVFPTLFIASYLLTKTHTEIGMVQICFLFTWLLCTGIRGILWHQMSDAENDRISGLITFVHRLKPSQVSVAGNMIIMIEVTSFLAFICSYSLPGVYAGLFLYGIYTYAILSKWNIKSIIFDPGNTSYRILMFDFYQVFFPLSILLQGCFVNSINILALIVHFILFPVNTVKIFNEAKRLVSYKNAL